MANRSKTYRRNGQLSAAAKMRRRIENGGERFWRVSDFPDLSPSAVARTLARLAKEGELERPRRGLYYKPRETSFGIRTLASPTAIAAESLKTPVQPAGLTAANALGLTTQNPVISELVTPANNPPGGIDHARVKTRRPEARLRLSEREGALLEVLRDRARSSDLDFAATRKRLRRELENPKVFRRIALAAMDEPPRVRAMLGALGQELNADQRLLERLRKSLNPLSRYEFGRLRRLRYAREWQAK